MGSFSDDDKSSDNDEDEEMEDLDGGDVDPRQEVDQEHDNEDDTGDGFEDDDQDDTQDMDDSPSRSLSRRQTNTYQNSNQDLRRRTLQRHYSQSNGHVSAPESPRESAMGQASPFHPTLRPEAVTASLYDIVPTIAAPHSTSINAVTATPDMRWVFSGGSDGWVRKFNWVDTLNARSMLTVAQRHPFVDSVQKAGVLTGYWENEDIKGKTCITQHSEDNPSLSPVYSLAVHHQALWVMAGTESGVINLHAVRHDEGKRITSLYKHSSAVSVMVLSHDEFSLLSGSWDKTINDWDLNTGQVKRSFLGSGGQISAIEMRPVSDVPIPRDFAESQLPTSDTFMSDGMNPRKSSGAFSNANMTDDRRPSDINPVSPGDSLFGGGDSLFGDNDVSAVPGGGFGDDEDDNEFSRAFAGGVDQQPEAVGHSLDDLTDAQGDIDVAMPDLDTQLLPNGDISFNHEPIHPLSASDDVFGPSASHNFDAYAMAAGELKPHTTTTSHHSSPSPEELTRSESIFLDAAIDGTIRIWDRRQPSPIARMVPPRGTPPWCMHACWSADGNRIYAGRRNGTVDEYNISGGLHAPSRTLHFPGGSGAVSAVRAMPNGKHLICASFDILRLYDLKDEENSRKSSVPFLIVPGHRTGVVSQLYLDATGTYMISTGGNRGWEGASTEVLLGYEIGFTK